MAELLISLGRLSTAVLSGQKARLRRVGGGLCNMRRTHVERALGGRPGLDSAERGTCDKVLLTSYTSPTILLAAAALVLCFAQLSIPPALKSSLKG